LPILPGLTYLAPTVTAPTPTRIAGLTDPVVLPPERVPIRTRETGVTLSAWKMAATAQEGAGALVRVEAPSGSVFRGEGWFLGWSQEQLSAAWTALLPPAPRETISLPQLG
jgi:hypothetical protein